MKIFLTYGNIINDRIDVRISREQKELPSV
jgi:hypothetical protein